MCCCSCFFCLFIYFLLFFGGRCKHTKNYETSGSVMSLSMLYYEMKVFTAYHSIPIHILFLFLVYWDNLVCSTHFHFYNDGL